VAQAERAILQAVVEIHQLILAKAAMERLKRAVVTVVLVGLALSYFATPIQEQSPSERV
jgi:hypothetical protein